MTLGFEYNEDKVSKMTELKQVTFQDIGVSKNAIYDYILATANNQL